MITCSCSYYLKVICLLIFLGLTSSPGASQCHQSIILEEIPQSQVRKYIESKSIDQMDDFSSIHSSWEADNEVSEFNTIRKTFYLKYTLSEVWDFYLNSDPMVMWNGHSISLGLVISKTHNSVAYTNNPAFPRIDTGQVYFLDLRLVKGLLNVPVAFEIINIDRKNKIVEFSYIDKNISSGKQTIRFFDNGDGRTRIVHMSYFKSGSPLRDIAFYPYFHKKLINDFHKNVRHLIYSAGYSVSEKK